MCMDPVSAVLIAGTAVSAAGTIYGGISSKKAADANAAQAEQQAALRRQQALVDIETADRNQRRVMGKTLAAIGTSGVDARSFLDVINDDLQEGALEKIKIKYGGENDAKNLQTGAANTRRAGKAALIGSVFSAAGTAAQGYGRVSSYQTRASASGSSDYADI